MIQRAMTQSRGLLHIYDYKFLMESLMESRMDSSYESDSPAPLFSKDCFKGQPSAEVGTWLAARTTCR